MTDSPAASSPSPDSLSASRRRWILAALMCTMMLVSMDTTIVSTAIPQVVGDLGGLSLFSWVFSIYLLGQTVMIPVYGKLSDLYGRKPILIIGTVIFLIASVASAAAWDMVSLIVFRGIQGLGAGAILATVATVAGDLYSVRERAAVQGWLSSVWGIAAIAGPTLGGAFATYASWRWIFLVNVPIGAVALALIGVFLKEKFEPRRPRIDYAGSALVLAAVGMFMFALLQSGQSWPWLSWQTAFTFGLSVLLFIALIWVERRAEEPVMPGWVWRRVSLAGPNLATLGLGIVMMAPMAYLPTFLQSTHGLGAIMAGLVLATMSMGWPTASALSGRIYLRIGFRNTALVGVFMTLFASINFTLLPGDKPVWMIACNQVLLGAGLGLMSTPLLVGVQSIVSWGQRGVVTGANMFARYLGESLGAAIFGAIFNAAVGAQLARAPEALAQSLPSQVDGVITALHEGRLAAPAQAYLRDTIATATSDLFIAMAILSALIMLILFRIPRELSLDTAGLPGAAPAEKVS